MSRKKIQVVSSLKTLVKDLFFKLGWEFVRINSYPDMEDRFKVIHRKCTPFTMTSIERMYALYESVRYVIRENIPGDIVECGTWKGGSCMLCAFALQELGHTDRKLWLYDTFEGMSLPTSVDIRHDNRDATSIWRTEYAGDRWCYASLEEVRENMFSTGYPLDNIEFVKGKVEETLTGRVPRKISILRLDTDWYESTLVELKVLFPLLVEGGVLLLDDYGYWQGSKKAVDQYIGENGIRALLVRLDFTGRIALKTSPGVKEFS